MIIGFIFLSLIFSPGAAEMKRVPSPFNFHDGWIEKFKSDCVNGFEDMIKIRNLQTTQSNFESACVNGFEDMIKNTQFSDCSIFSSKKNFNDQDMRKDVVQILYLGNTV